MADRDIIVAVTQLRMGVWAPLGYYGEECKIQSDGAILAPRSRCCTAEFLPLDLWPKGTPRTASRLAEHGVAAAAEHHLRGAAISVLAKSTRLEIRQTSFK